MRLCSGDSKWESGEGGCRIEGGRDSVGCHLIHAIWTGGKILHIDWFLIITTYYILNHIFAFIKSHGCFFFFPTTNKLVQGVK